MPPPSAPPKPPKNAPAEPGWPAAVPALEEAIQILKGVSSSPPQLKEVTDQVSKALTFEERAALIDTEPNAAGVILCEVAGTRWRIAAALNLRPKNGEPPDEASLEQLIEQIDTSLKKLGSLQQSDDKDLKAACDTAKVSLARGISQLLPTTSAESAHSAEAMERTTQKQTEEALVKARVAMLVDPSKSAKVGKRPPNRFVTLAGILAAAAAVGFGVLQLIPPSEQPVPTLPAAPAGTVLLGDPRGGSVILSSTSGQPLNPDVVTKFSAEARAAGAVVRELGPTQLLVSAQRPAHH